MPRKKKKIGGRAKKPVNGRQKGARGERQVKLMLQKWWGGKFFRSPGSGAFATRGFSSKVADMSGDIVTTDPTFPFSVECKWREDWLLEQLLTAKKCVIHAWWQQTLQQTPSDKIALLIFKRNNSQWYYMMLSKTWCSFMSASDVWENTFIYKNVTIGVLSDLMSTDPNIWKR